MKDPVIEIKEAIQSASRNKKDVNYDVLGGKASEIYFRIYLKKMRGEPYDPEEDLLILVERINSPGYTFGSLSGLAGVYYTIKCLKQLYPSYLEADGLYFQMEQLIIDLLPEFLNERNFDFLHGSSGIIWCLADEKGSFPNLISAFVDKLFSVFGYGEGLFGFSKFDDNRGAYSFVDGFINGSLCHGLSGLLLVLTRLYESGYERTRIKILCENLITLYDYLKIKDKRSAFCNLFPDHSSFTRMAWCTGDMGIALAQWNTGKVFGWQEVQENAFKLMLRCSHRISLSGEQVYDAGFCHGAAGLCQMFYRFYGVTGEMQFKGAMNFWHLQTRRFKTEGVGLAGYRSWQGDAGWQQEYGLLEGIAGIGLVLMQAENGYPMVSDWDRIFLLS